MSDGVDRDSAAGGNENDTLTITLSCNTSCPTVSIGDTITFGEFCGGRPGHFGSRIKDENGASVAGIFAISGNFGGATPAVTSVNPNTASNNMNTVVTINGTGLNCARSVYLVGGSPETWTSLAWTPGDNTYVTATIPACTFAAGTYHIRIWSNEGYSPATSNDDVTVVSSLTVTSVIPNTAVNNVDTPVTIAGSGFSCATGVMLGTTNLTIWSIDNDNQIAATIPAGITPGTYHTLVKSNFGDSPQTANDQVEVVAP